MREGGKRERERERKKKIEMEREREIDGEKERERATERGSEQGRERNTCVRGAAKRKTGPGKYKSVRENFSSSIHLFLEAHFGW